MSDASKKTRSYFINRTQPILRAIEGVDPVVVGRLMNKILDTAVAESKMQSVGGIVARTSTVFSNIRLLNSGDAEVVKLMLDNRAAVKKVIQNMILDIAAVASK